ncbi:MAG: hypothetical protein KF752_12360 [Pirellulaceae bacterium]|nr:hypothetical protein [Pirellulaceae bacterium]
MNLKYLLCGVLLAAGSSLYAQANERPVAIESVDMINRLHQREWVRLQEDGKIVGRIVVIESPDTLRGRIDNKIVLSRDGKIVFETVSGTDGWFQIEGVDPGSYALQAIGDYTFATFALHILPADAGHLASTLDVYTTTIGNKVRELMVSSMVPADLTVGEDQYYRTHKIDPIATQRQFNRDHQVKLQDGDLIGRVSRPGWSYSEQDLSGSVAHIIKGGEVLDKALVDKDGFYKFADVAPGVYDMLVAGPDGFAAFKFQAVDDDIASEVKQASNQSEVHLVAANAANMVAADTLNTELVHQSDVFPAASEGVIVGGPCESCGIVEAYGAGGSPCSGGGFAGGGGCCGGGGGGLFAGGGLLGAAGLATGIVALASSGGSTPPPPTVIAP